MSFEGYVTVKNARLWTLPKEPPPLLGAAISEETSRWLGNWADGLLTTADRDLDEVERKINAFRQARRERKPVYVKYTFSYARNLQAAIDEAWEEWKGQITAHNRADIATPDEFDRLSRQTTREEVLEVTPVFSDMEALKEQIDKLETLDVDRIILHNLGKHQEEFIEDFAAAFAGSEVWMSREQQRTTQWHASRPSTQ